MKVRHSTDRQIVRVNGTKVWTDEFAWDECHKIYLVTDQVSRNKLEGYGYEFFPINKLKDVWDDSCSLRFISDASLSQSYISQFEEEDGFPPARIEYIRVDA